MRRALLLACTPLLVACAASPAANKDPKAPPATPPRAAAKPLAWPGVPHLRHAGREYFSGQPTEAGLRHAAKQGVRTVINLRKEPLPYEEAKLAKQLGLRYVRVPIDGRQFTAQDAAEFRAAIEAAKGPVLIHCHSGNRVGGMWTLYLIEHDKLSLKAALAQGRAAGLREPPTIARTKQVGAELEKRR